MKHIKRFSQLLKEDNSTPPIRNVVDSETEKNIGTHQYGKGFVPNKQGMELGYEAHPTSIPNKTKFDDSNYDLIEDDEKHDLDSDE
jgi:hypothetical protein